jgi:hypothetical protein
MGIFGFLSKAHNDQNLVSGDVQSKIAIYDEKIKTAKDNIDANRKALKQMDEAVDQVMGRSQDEKGADKAVAIRRGQQIERARLQAEITAEQKTISQISEERAPIAAEVRKVEAEVGPIKYIAKFIYGDSGADENMLEKAVTWIIVLIVVVFDPLAVIMLLAAQMTFGWKREEKEYIKDTVADIVEKPVKQAEDDSLTTESGDNIVIEPTVIENTHTEPVPSETPLTALGGDITAPEEPVDTVSTESELEKWNKMIAEAELELQQEAIKQEEAKKYHPEETTNSYTEVTGDRLKPDLTEVIEPDSDESKKKTYMIKDRTGQIQVKARE